MKERQSVIAASQASSHAGPAGFVRVPGFVFKRDITQVVRPGAEFFIEDAGTLNGVDLFRVYQRPEVTTAIGMQGNLTFDGESSARRAHVLPISAGEPWMGVVVLANSAEEAAATLAHVRAHLSQALSNAAGVSLESPAETDAPGGAS